MVVLTKVCSSKTCEKAGEAQEIGAFYVRSGVTEPSRPSDWLSECIQCMSIRNRNARKLSPIEPRVESERLAIDYLVERGIPALPGKAIGLSHVDIAAWGCVRVEVKYSKAHQMGKGFIFALTAKQERRGLLADVVMLICDYGDRQTYHLLKATDPVFFFSNGERKRYFDWKPGRMEQKKHFSDRTVLTQPIMDEAQDNVELIEQARVNWREHWAEFVASGRRE